MSHLSLEMRLQLLCLPLPPFENELKLFGFGGSNKGAEAEICGKKKSVEQGQ